MHIYAFGSVCRGEIDDASDVDLLAIVSKEELKPDPIIYSVYSYNRIEDLWREGNPFAWHLHKEARLIFASTGMDFLKDAGVPSPYEDCLNDCSKFRQLFAEAFTAYQLKQSIFELSVIFLAMRNFATCFALGYLGKFEFSRMAAQRLEGYSVDLSSEVHKLLERARLLSSRGHGIPVSVQEQLLITPELPKIELWMEKLMALVFLKNE